jgi:F0F1-type ATP synthase delta subunit
MAVKTIELDKFELLIKLFESLRNLFSMESTQKDWKQPLIKRFFQDLNNPEIFHLISEKLLKVQTIEIEKLKALEQALHYFSPQVVPFLVPVILQRSSPEIQQMVSDVIVKKSRRNIEPLEEIAEKHGAEMGGELLVILKRLQGERINKIIFRMCDHSSDIVRRDAIKELINRDPEYAQKLFSLIDDPSKEIRACILAAFAKHRSSALENMLLNYLKENSGNKDPAHILACYEALGRCGSNTSVPFLSKILLNRGWNSFMGTGKLVFREGAAIALSFIDTPEAKHAIWKASKSGFGVIRKALDGIKTISDFSGENTNV